jgi:hypothetical protein
MKDPEVERKLAQNMRQLAIKITKEGDTCSLCGTTNGIHRPLLRSDNTPIACIMGDFRVFAQEYLRTHIFQNDAQYGEYLSQFMPNDIALRKFMKLDGLDLDLVGLVYGKPRT